MRGAPARAEKAMKRAARVNDEVSNVVMRACKHHGVELHHVYWVKRGSSVGQVFNCERCKRERDHARYIANSAAFKAKARAWALANPAKRRFISRRSDRRRRATITGTPKQIGAA